MNNYFNNNFPNFPNNSNFSPNYVPSQYPNTGNINNNMGQGNFAPGSIGFDGFNNNFPGQMSTQYPQYFPPNSFNSPNYSSGFNVNEGFPIAPSNSSSTILPPSFNSQSYNSQSYNPQSFEHQPTYPDVIIPSVPQPNFYVPQVPFQSNLNEFNPNSQSNLNTYPNITQYNSNEPSYNQPEIQKNPTLRPFQPFNPAYDAEQLYKAMKGFGTDEAKLIDVLCKRTFDQRNEISQVFKTSYGKDLIKNIESETSGNFRRVLVSLLQRPMMVESIHLRESVAGLGTDEHSLIDVVCTKTNSEMMELKQTYFQLYKRNLEDDVKDDVSGYFKRFLVSLMNAHRFEAPPDYQKAVAQAKELYNAGEKRLGTNEVVFNRIIGAESHAHLRLVFDEYQKLTGHSIEQAIKSDMSTSVQRAFLTVIQYIRNPAVYYAQRLYESMKGLGTKDKLLVRMVVLRSEIDMMDIKIEFQKIYKKSLESFIKSDCSGDYKRALLCLVGDPNWK